MSLMSDIDHGSRHRRVQGDTIGMTLVMRNHIHPRIKRGLRSLLSARKTTNNPTITLIEDSREELILRRVVVQQASLGNIGCARNIRQRRRNKTTRGEKGQRLREDTRLFILTAGLRSTGLARLHCLGLIAHAAAPDSV